MCFCINKYTRKTNTCSLFHIHYDINLNKNNKTFGEIKCKPAECHEFSSNL